MSEIYYYGDQIGSLHPHSLKDYNLDFFDRTIQDLRYLNTILTPTQCRFVGAALRFASRFTANAMSSRVLLARYINAPMALR
jgi:hypothetical protein